MKRTLILALLIGIYLSSNPDWSPPTWNHLTPQYMNYDV